MTCYVCNAPAAATCPRCGRAYCPDHGADICARCADPASVAPPALWYRGSLLALALGSAAGIWLLVAPPDLKGSGAAMTGGPEGAIGAPAAGATATPAAGPSGSPSPTGTPGEERYTVRPGDTLAGIAARFNTTADAIARANGITSDLIRPGQELRIPR